MSEINVLSLFDGLSAGRVALERAGIPVANYFSSEIDKNAIKIADHNWSQDIPNRLGDVRLIDGSTLPKIQLVCGGSPCQSFSFSGQRKGMSTKENVEVTTLARYLELKSEGVEFHGESYLFWEFVRLLEETKPDYFLLENVRMKKVWEDVISGVLGRRPILINSSLVSAQSRNRLYWTNIPNVAQPEDKGILAKDIFEHSHGGHFSDGFYVVPRGANSGGLKHYKGKSPTITTSSWQHNFFACQKIEENLAELLKTSKYKDNFGWKFDKLGRILVTYPPNHHKIQRIGRVACSDNKTEIVLAFHPPCVNDGLLIRKVTPLEAERLQTLSDGYTDCGLSANQRFHAIGNGWTVDVIAHIFKSIPK